MVVGKRGSGKTFLVKKLLNELQPKRLVIFDPLNEYADGLVVTDVIDLCNRLETTEHFRYILRFDTQEDFRLALEAVYLKGDLLLVVEEVSYFANERSIDASFDSIVRFGRHRKVDLIGITQRCANVPRLLTSQMDIIISYKQTEPRDLEYLYRVVGDEAYDLNELGLYEYKTFFL